MKAAVRRALCTIAYHAGAVRTALAVTNPANAAPRDRPFQILVYHRVGLAVDTFLPGVRVADFREQMRWLARNFRVLSLSQLLDAARRHDVPPRALAVTFDDGYADTYTHAFPILRNLGIPATVYLITGLIGGNRSMWNDVVGLAIRNTHAPFLDCVPDCDRYPLHGPAAKSQALEATLRALKRLPPTERDRVVEKLVTQLRVRVDAAPRMLTWDQVREMHAAGIEFGAHSVHHPILTAVSHREARDEIVTSKRAVEERLQCAVRHFAYPNGRAPDFNEATKDLVRQAGFESAASMLFGSNDSRTDLLELRRGGAWDPEPAVFATQLWWNGRERPAGKTA